MTEFKPIKIDSTCSEMVIVIGNRLSNTSSNLDKAVCISHANMLGKGMHPIILPPAIGR